MIDQIRVEALAQAVLDARPAGETLAALYDPLTMPVPLRRAHEALDRAVERLYRPVAFSSDAERVEFLLGQYEEMIAPLLTTSGRKRRKV